MDLDSLFTNTDYQTITVQIPCHRWEDDGNSSSATNNNDDKLCDKQENDDDDDHNNTMGLSNHELDTDHHYISVELECSQAASTDFDLTGQILWPVSVLLGHYLASQRGQERIRNRSVLELGAGCGLPGLVAAHYADSVIVTDGNDVVVDLLQRNVETFLLEKTRTNKTAAKTRRKRILHATKLVWGHDSNCRSVLSLLSTKDQQRRAGVDVVIAADVVQWPAVVEPLLHTVKAFLWSSTTTAASSSKNHHHPPTTTTPVKEEETRLLQQPVFVLGIVNRANSTFDLFCKLAKELGFALRSVSPEEYLADGKIPKSCREDGGRKTEIYELFLTDRSVPPVLLQEEQQPGHNSNDHDNNDNSNNNILLGKSFENTAFLPY